MAGLNYHDDDVERRVADFLVGRARNLRLLVVHTHGTRNAPGGYGVIGPGGSGVTASVLAREIQAAGKSVRAGGTGRCPILLLACFAGGPYAMELAGATNRIVIAASGMVHAFGRFGNMINLEEVLETSGEWGVYSADRRIRTLNLRQVRNLFRGLAEDPDDCDEMYFSLDDM